MGELTSPNDLKDSNFWFDGYVIGHGIEILECSEIEHEVLSNRAMVSGIVYVSCETESFQYNAARDPGEEKFSYISEQFVTYEIYFNFDLLEDEECSEFEITDMSINSID